MIDTAPAAWGKARPAWMEAALNALHRLGYALRRRPVSTAFAQVAIIALIALSAVPDAVCVEIEQFNETSTSNDGARNESSTSRRVCLNGELADAPPSSSRNPEPDPEPKP